MYKSRKKILAVSGISVVVLSGFAIGAWAIIDASYKNPSGDALQAKYYGATEYLSDNGAGGQLDINTMSISDWINYNMPQTVVVTKNNNTTSYDFYTANYTGNDLSAFIKQNGTNSLIARVNLNTATNSSYSYEVYTNPNVSNQFVGSSNTTKNGNSITMTNKFGWSNNETSVDFNKYGQTETKDEYNASNIKTSTTTTDTFRGTLNNLSLSYEDSVKTNYNTDANQTINSIETTKTFSTSYQDSKYTQTYTKTESKSNSANNYNFDITYKGTLSNSLRASYTTTANPTQDQQYYYRISYSNNGTNVTGITQYQGLWLKTNSNGENAWQMSLSKDINLFFFNFI